MRALKAFWPLPAARTILQIVNCVQVHHVPWPPIANRDPSGWISTENSGLPMNGRQPIKSNVWKTLKMNHVKVFEKKISFSIREQSSASLNCLRWYRSTSADFHRLAWMKTDEWLTLEAWASESLYGGRFTSSNRLIKPDYLVVSLIDTAQQIL